MFKIKTFILGFFFNDIINFWLLIINEFCLNFFYNMSNPSKLVLENNINTIIPYSLEEFSNEIENRDIK